jgi:hypothetical protein
LLYRNQAKINLLRVLSLRLLELNLCDAFFDYLFEAANKSLSKDFMREFGPVDQERLDNQITKGVHRCNCRSVLELVRNLEQP